MRIWMRKIWNNESSKRKFLIFSLLFSIVTSFLIATEVSYANSIDSMIPKDDKTETLYNKYGPSHYAFQTATPDRHFWQIGAKATDGVNTMYDHMLSGVFIAGAQITRFFNFITREAFEFKMMEALIDGVETIIKGIAGVEEGSMGSGLWGSMYGVFASITIIFALWQIIRLRFFETMQTLLSFLLALVISLAFISQAGTFLKLINTGSSELAATMYSALAVPGGLSANTNEGVSSISDQVWNQLVMKPYAMLQFDDPNAYENVDTRASVEKVLATEPFSEERDKALKDVKDTFPAVTAVRAQEQMIILVFNGIFAAFILGLFCFWAIVTIFIRVKLLIHAAIMAVTLLASLLPGREAGLSVIRGQFIKLIGFAMMTVFTQFFLVLSLVMGNMTFNIAYNQAKLGWFVAMILESIVVAVVFKYRNEIGSVFSKAAGHIPMSPKAKSTVADAIQRNVTRSVYNKAGAVVGGIFKRHETDGVPSNINPAAISKAGTSLNDATAASMQLRYQREKDASEQIAVETGQHPQYTPFVQNVNDNLRTGKNAFRGMDKDWKEEKSRLKSVKDGGGDMKQAVLSHGVHEGMNDQQVAAKLYANENAIRKASTFMVNRPKDAVAQIQRAGSLNKNRKLETSVNDFVMVELFERYKVEYKKAIDTSAVSGEPVKHSDFVKNMDDRFRATGLTTTQSINVTMGSRHKRGAIASQFSSMPEFGEKRDELLTANSAFRKASTSTEPVKLSVPTVNTAGPINATALAKRVPVISPKPMHMKVETPVSLSVSPKVNTSVDVSKIKLPDNLKGQMNEAKDKLKDSATAGMVPGEKLVINSSNKTEVLVKLGQKISTQTSGDLENVKKELEIMSRANGHRLQEAAISSKNSDITKKAQTTVQAARPKKPKGISAN